MFIKRKHTNSVYCSHVFFNDPLSSVASRRSCATGAWPCWPSRASPPWECWPRCRLAKRMGNHGTTIKLQENHRKTIGKCWIHHQKWRWFANNNGWTTKVVIWPTVQWMILSNQDGDLTPNNCHFTIYHWDRSIDKLGLRQDNIVMKHPFNTLIYQHLEPS